MSLSEQQRELCTTSVWDFSDLRALYVNCTLKPSPDVSNTQGLIDLSIAIMEATALRSIGFARSTMRLHPVSIRT